MFEKLLLVKNGKTQKYMTRNIHIPESIHPSNIKLIATTCTLRSLELRSISLFRMSIAMHSNKFKICNNNIVNKTYLSYCIQGQISVFLRVHVFTHALYKNMCITESITILSILIIGLHSQRYS